MKVPINCQIAQRHPPLPAMEENIMDSLLEHFTKTAFENNVVFPSTSSPTANIHLKEGASPLKNHGKKNVLHLETLTQIR